MLSRWPLWILGLTLLTLLGLAYGYGLGLPPFGALGTEVFPSPIERLGCAPGAMPGRTTAEALLRFRQLDLQ